LEARVQMRRDIGSRGWRCGRRRREHALSGVRLICCYRRATKGLCSSV
jgi:hypothetical protein